MQALTIALLTRHNDIPDTARPAPKSPVSEPVTASGADTVFTHAASAVCQHHHDAEQTRTVAFGCLTRVNAPLFPPRKHNSPAECARFLPLRIRLLLFLSGIVGKHKTHTRILFPPLRTSGLQQENKSRSSLIVYGRSPRCPRARWQARFPNVPIAVTS